MKKMLSMVLSASMVLSLIAGRDQGMITMDESLMKLYEAGRIDKEAALMYASNSERMRKKLNM